MHSTISKRPPSSPYQTSLTTPLIQITLVASCVWWASKINHPPHDEHPLRHLLPLSRKQIVRAQQVHHLPDVMSRTRRRIASQPRDATHPGSHSLRKPRPRLPSFRSSTPHARRPPPRAHTASKQISNHSSTLTGSHAASSDRTHLRLPTAIHALTTQTVLTTHRVSLPM